MKRTLRMLLFLALLVFSLIALLILASPYLLKAYQKEIADYLGKSLQRKVVVEKVSLSLWPGPGLNVSGITIYNLAGFKNPILLKLRSLKVELALLPLLQQRLESRAIEISGPQLYLETRSDGVSNLNNPQGMEKTVSEPASQQRPEIFPGIQVSDFRITGGTISQSNNRSHDTVLLKGIDLDLNHLEYTPGPKDKSFIEGVRVAGFLKVAQGNINQFEFDHLSGKIRFDKMNLLLKDWTLNSYGGNITGDLTLRPGDAEPLYHFAGKTEKIRVKDLLNTLTSARNTLEGEFNSEVLLDGGGLSLASMEKNLSGKGGFDLRHGTLKTVNLIQQISFLSKLSGLVHGNAPETKLESLRGQWSVERGKFIFRELIGALPEGEIHGGGTVDFHQMMDFHVKVLLNKEETERIPESGRLLFAGENQQAEFPLHLEGPVKSPSVRLETKEMTQRAVKEGLSKGVKSLLERFK